jgi:uncharacterized delta-60 repeat protein
VLYRVFGGQFLRLVPRMGFLEVVRMLTKQSDIAEFLKLATIVGLTATLVLLSSCSQTDDASNSQLQPGSMAALSTSGSLLDGAVVTQIGPYNDVPRAMTILPDGKLIVAGASYDDRLVDLFIARFDRGGRLDSTFGNQGIVTTPFGSGNDRVEAVAIQKDGKLLAVGGRHNGQDLDTSVSRYHLDGSLDTGFAQGGVFKISMGVGNDIANAVAMDAEGNIVLVGTGHDDVGAIGFTVLRLNSDGGLDTSFANAGKMVLRLGTGTNQGQDVATQVAIDPEGRLVITGTVMNEMQKELGVVRLTSNGARDATFGNQGQLIIAVSEGDDEATALAVQPDSKVLVAVSVFKNGKRGVALYRLAANGGFDTFGEQSSAVGGSLSTVNQINVLADGKILLAGSFYHRETRSDFAMERFLANGQIDVSFGKLGRVHSAVSRDNDSINVVAIGSSSQLVVAGVVHEVQKKLGLCLASYDSEGMMDTRFGSGSFL